MIQKNSLAISKILVISLLFIGCGRQVRTITIDEENGGGSLDGIHSSDGWRGSLPLRVYVSQEILDSTRQEITTASNEEVSAQAILDQIQSAMRTWEEALNMSYGSLFKIAGFTALKGSNFPTLYDPLQQSINGLYYDFAWTRDTQKSEFILATTIWTPKSSNRNAIDRMNVRYNSQFYAFGDSTAHKSKTRKMMVDLWSLSLHELGHGLGLSHVDEVDSVMQPSMHIGENATMRELSANDVERIRSIYLR